jgi:hypothetical protein
MNISVLDLTHQKAIKTEVVTLFREKWYEMWHVTT